jgi:hypothetical protein
MSHKYCVHFVLCAILGSASSGGFAQESSKEASIASLVRTLGYGGAIHNFKNFVLRGDQRYGNASRKLFARASELLAALDRDNSLTADQKRAVAAIRKVVERYQANLPNVEQLRGQGKTVEEIDERVSVDDSGAVESIVTLRRGHPWSKTEDLEFHLGYGSGIHNFKNFVLRADEEYRARTLLGLSKVLLIVARYRAAAGLAEEQISALDAIESVVRAYEEALPRVQQLIGQGKTALEIDTAVKVDDAPALQGLETLRKE